MSTQICRLDRALLSITGKDRYSFLQGLITQDIFALTPECPLYALFLSPQGKFQADFFLIRQDQDESILLDCALDRAAYLQKRLSLFKLRSDVCLSDVSSQYHVYALWGEDINKDSHDGFVDPRLPELGRRIVLPAEQTRETSTHSQAYENLCIQWGIPDGTKDAIIDKGIPLECGYNELHAISWTKGCYMGQELTARTHYRGLIRKRLIPCRIVGPSPASGDTILQGDQEVGSVRSIGGDFCISHLRLTALNAPSSPLLLTNGETSLIPCIPYWMRLPEPEQPTSVELGGYKK